MFDKIVSARIEEIMSEVTGNTLIFLKGFPILQIQKLIQHPNALLADSSFIENGFLNLDALNNKWFDFVALR